MTRIEEIKAQVEKAADSPFFALSSRELLWLLERNAELLKVAKYFVRWADDCWGATEILSPEVLSELEQARAAIAAMESK